MSDNETPHDHPATFEAGFACVEEAARSLLDSVKLLETLSRKLQRAAGIGQIEAIRRTADALDVPLQVLEQRLAAAKQSWPFSPDTETEYLRTLYEAELLETARKAGVTIRKQEERLQAFPVFVRILPEAKAVRLDKAKALSLRPRTVVELIKKQQSKRPRFNSERILEALFASYRLVSGPERLGSTQSLDDIYKVLTLLPGSSREYGMAEFIRDLYLIETQGVRRTKSGYSATFISPSSAAREGRGHLFVTEAGEERRYYGIRFTEVKNDDGDPS